MACKSRSLVNYRSDKTVVFSEFVKFQRAIWRNADKTVSKWRFSDPCVWQRSHFWLHFEAGKSQFAMVNIWCCQNFGDLFEIMLTKLSLSEIWVLYAFGTETTFGCFLNLGKVNLEGSTFEVAKIWDRDRFEKILTKLSPSKFECFMPLAQKPHSAAFWSWKTEFGMVNVWCCQNFGNRFQEMLTKLSSIKSECFILVQNLFK